jgi:hypothetical protein
MEVASEAAMSQHRKFLLAALVCVSCGSGESTRRIASDDDSHVEHVTFTDSGCDPYDRATATFGPLPQIRPGERWQAVATIDGESRTLEVLNLTCREDADLSATTFPWVLDCAGSTSDLYLLPDSDLLVAIPRAGTSARAFAEVSETLLEKARSTDVDGSSVFKRAEELNVLPETLVATANIPTQSWYDALDSLTEPKRDEVLGAVSRSLTTNTPEWHALTRLVRLRPTTSAREWQQRWELVESWLVQTDTDLFFVEMDTADEQARRAAPDLLMWEAVRLDIAESVGHVACELFANDASFDGSLAVWANSDLECPELYRQALEIACGAQGWCGAQPCPVTGEVHSEPLRDKSTAAPTEEASSRRKAAAIEGLKHRDDAAAIRLARRHYMVDSGDVACAKVSHPARPCRCPGEIDFGQKACEAEADQKLINLGTCQLEIDDTASVLVTREPGGK